MFAGAGSWSKSPDGRSWRSATARSRRCVGNAASRDLTLASVLYGPVWHPTAFIVRVAAVGLVIGGVSTVGGFVCSRRSVSAVYGVSLVIYVAPSGLRLLAQAGFPEPPSKSI
jgi:hypothetical protein